MGLTMSSPLRYFDEVVAAKLQACNTAGEMLQVLNKEYELTQSLGFATKFAFQAGLRAAVSMIQPPIKNGV